MTDDEVKQLSAGVTLVVVSLTTVKPDSEPVRLVGDYVGVEPKYQDVYVRRVRVTQPVEGKL